jgi:type I restriction enzyme S subunit
MASDWIIAKLGDVLEIKYGKDHKKLNDGDIPCFGSGGIMRHVEESLYEQESILIPRKGSLNNIYYVDRPFWTVDTLFWTKIDSDTVFPKFLFYQLKLVDFVSLNVGSAVPSLTVPVLNDLEVKLPPLPEQKAIAHILGTLDDKIELNRQMNETLEAMAQAVFKSWFVDFDPVIDNALAAGNAIPDEFAERAEQRKTIEKKDNADIQKLFPDEFEFTEEMGWIPKGWGVSKVEEEFDVTMGQSPPGSTYNESGEGIYFFQGSTDFGFRYPTPRIYCTAPKRIAKKRDTLVSVRAPVGDTNIAADDCCIGRGLAALRHKSGSASFTYYSMLQLKENFKIYEGEGTVFGSINQKDFKGLLQLKASDSLVSKFEVKAGALDSKIELNSLNIIKLAKLRDTLLPKLMSGELRIPDAAALVDEAV